MWISQEIWQSPSPLNSVTRGVLFDLTPSAQAFLVKFVILLFVINGFSIL